MDLLKELVELNEAEKKKKKKGLKQAAKAVYHRDYVKTKNRPYRKYDPAEYQRKHTSEDVEHNDDQLDEGMFDYLKAAGGAAAQKTGAAATAVGSAIRRVGPAVAQQVRDIHQQGQAASQAADLKKLEASIPMIVKQLGEITIKMNQINRHIDVQPQPIANEGFMDYLKGVGGFAAKKGKEKVEQMREKGRRILRPFKAMHHAGTVASLKGDYRNYSVQKKQLIAKLANIAKRLGPTGPQLVIAAINQQFARTQIGIANNLRSEFTKALSQTNKSTP